MSNFFSTLSSTLFGFKDSFSDTKASIILLFLTYPLVRHVVLKIYQKAKKLPPDPTGLPFIGSVVSMALGESSFWSSLRSYGGITSFFVFNKRLIVINDPVIASKILKNPKCLSRVIRKRQHKFTDTGDSIITLPYGRKWKKLRKVSQNNFMLQLNSKMLENSVYESFHNVWEPAIKKSIEENKKFYPRKYLSYTSFNNIFTINFGSHISMDDERYTKYISDFKIRMKYATLLVFSAFIDINSSLIANYLKNKMLQSHTSITSSLENWILKATGYRINALKNIFKFEGNKYIEFKNGNTSSSQLFINELQNPLNDYMNNNDCFNNIDALFSAGVDTTDSSGEYIITLLAKQVEVQNDIYNELKNIFKNEKKFSFDVIHKLHLFRAFIHEGLRLSSVAKNGVPRYTTGEIKYGNYILPKGSIVLLDMKGINVHHKSWPNNGNFNLYNFLNNKNEFKQNKNFMAFSIGQRNCPGKSVAIRSLYAFFGNLILNYKVELINNIKEIEQDSGVVLKLKNEIPLRMIKRN